MSNHGAAPRGWLLSAAADARWPGVLLHRDAFVAHVEPGRLLEPPGDLVVVVDGAAWPVAEILLIEERIAEPADRSVPPDGQVAMVRLAEPVPSAVSVVVPRAALERAWREGRSMWSTLRELGVHAGGEPAPIPSPATGPDLPAAIPVKVVTADPFDWCTIFWWLC